MNDALQKALTTLLHQISGAGHVVANQLPDVLRQLIDYQLFEEWFIVILFGTLLLISTWMIGHHIPRWWPLVNAPSRELSAEKEEQMAKHGLLGFLSVPVWIASFATVATNVVTLVELEFMPKAWLLDYIRSAIGH